jgi:hypothetical protein
MKNIFTRTRNMKWVMKSGMILSACMILTASPVLANREPVFTHNLGGTPISCSIYMEEASIDGVHMDDTSVYVLKKLGTPRSIRKEGGILKYYYEGVDISFADYRGNGTYTAFNIETSSEGHYTPGGVGVGMGEQVLSDIYGTADSVWTKTYNSPKLSEEVNQKNQARFNETIYTYNVNEGISMSFTVKKGLISEISIYQSE